MAAPDYTSALMSPTTGHPGEFAGRAPDTAAVEELRERPLRVFAIDPARGSGPRNVVTLRLPYEHLEPGPIGQSVAVIDQDMGRGLGFGDGASEPVTYPGVDLDAREVLLAGGLEPSEVDLQSHQQMVYAVTMRTIGAFERALGRPIRWPWASAARDRPEDRLRIYPHASEMANAYYDPGTGALYFGYFRRAPGPGAAADEIVYTALSYDLIAHEVTHPIVASVLPFALGATTPDGQAFHEGFGDLVAILQHFAFNDLVVETIIGTGGRIHDQHLAADLDAGAGGRAIRAEVARSNPLLEIGGQFGEAVGMGGPVRRGLVGEPDPAALETTTEAHARGAILLSAVFDAFVTVYARRTADLRRIAGLPRANAVISPDLALRMAAEAMKAAEHFLTICIRALHYCPPTEIGFGDYLRALITSDREVVRDDPFGYRQALIDSFRARGIPAEGVTSYTEEGLCWPAAQVALPDGWATDAGSLEDGIRAHREAFGFDARRDLDFASRVTRPARRLGPDGVLSTETSVQVVQRGRRGAAGVGATIVFDAADRPKYVIRRGPDPASTAARPGRRHAASATNTPGPARLPDIDRSATTPERRTLKTFAFDPGRGGASNRLSLSLPYEPLGPGPVGRTVAVVDYDASNDRYYPAVDLDTPELLRRGGVDPSDIDPLFHQQMAYAVTTSTIERFETALGRPIRWPWARGASSGALRDRLRVYPHAMQEANAYYDRRLRGLLFGYFAAAEEQPGRTMPGQIVYTCLSQDIVAHETTHALLDSVQPYYLERTGPDAPAFHEAFADVIALLGHFTIPDALLDTIRRTGGMIHRDLVRPDAEPAAGGARVAAERAEPNPLIALAQQFGESLGNRGALRSALGKDPDPRALAAATEPHDRGAILVAAVFDAFFSVYLRRAADLLRIGRAGGAITSAGDIHPDLAQRLAREATDTAARVASIATRALDYCPPVDVEFGDYLRALVTADYERVPDDPLGFRAAFIDGFAARGIYAPTAWSMTEDALRWSRVRFRARVDGLSAAPAAGPRNAALLRGLVTGNAALFGVDASLPLNIQRVQASASQQLERTGGARTEYRVQVVQRRLVPLDPEDHATPMFAFRGGATIILDESGSVRYVIRKDIADEARLARQRAYLDGGALSRAEAAYRGRVLPQPGLAGIHRGDG